MLQLQFISNDTAPPPPTKKNLVREVSWCIVPSASNGARALPTLAWGHRRGPSKVASGSPIQGSLGRMGGGNGGDCYGVRIFELVNSPSPRPPPPTFAVSSIAEWSTDFDFSDKNTMVGVPYSTRIPGPAICACIGTAVWLIPNWSVGPGGRGSGTSAAQRL